MPVDPRRAIPATDTLLGLPEVVAAGQHLAPHMLRSIITQVQNTARAGQLAPDDVVAEVLEQVQAANTTTLTPVLNATGVVIHTNLGRAPLAPAARQALLTAAGYVDLEMDLATGKRSGRGIGATRALLARVPQAQAALIVNNGAAALALATTALSVAKGTPDVVLSRGEMVEIGAGFRLPDLIASTGVQLAEVGTTNRTTLDDYRAAITETTGALLKIHPSNYWIGGFGSAVSTGALATLAHEYGVPLIVDVGSGVLTENTVLPKEPSIAAALDDGADVVLASGDKLLGGPQAGLLLGTKEAIDTLAKHPLARAFRADKFTLAALEATLNSADTPVATALQADISHIEHRTRTMAQTLAPVLDADVVTHVGRVGGGGGAGVELPGWALRLDEAFAKPLRTGTPAILPRVFQGRCLVDLRCIPENQDDAVLARLQEIAAQVHP